MRGLVAGIMVGTLALGGCGSRSTGVVEAADGMLSLTVSGPSLPAATERGLHDATAHCAAQRAVRPRSSARRMRTGGCARMAFRCAGRAPGTPAQTAFPQPVPAAPPMVLLQPEAAPLLNGEAARPAHGAAAGRRPAVGCRSIGGPLGDPPCGCRVPGGAAGPPAGHAGAPPTLPARAAAAPLPPLSGPVGLRRD